MQTQTPHTRSRAPGWLNAGSFIETFQVYCRDNQKLLALLLLKLEDIDLLEGIFPFQDLETLIENMEQKLKNELRSKDCLFRIQHNKFALILPDLASRELVSLVAHKLMTVLDEIHRINGDRLQLKGRIGATFAESGAELAATLIKQANSALFDAGRLQSPLVIYQEKLSEQTSYRHSLGNEIIQAIENEEYFLEFQPQLNLLSGCIENAEALIRWQNGKHGLVRPDVFISIAESNGNIGAISEWVIQNAIRYLAELNERDIDIAVSINLSASDLNDPQLLEFIEQHLQLFGVKPERLALELTEGSMMQSSKKVLDQLNCFRAMGIAISIDDFGTGYSSLKYLKDLPVNELKIDRSFIQELPDSQPSRQIVRAIIDLANNFELELVAEGVETKETLDFLKDLGCHKIQGYYISRPLSEAVFPDFVREFNSHPAS